MKIHHSPQPNTCSLKESVLQKIESGEVKPRPKWWFMCGECLMYMFWGVSVVLGAVAVSVIVFVTEHSMYALIEATHRSALAFAVDVLPLAWIAVFVVMAVLAYKNYRQTSTGYRHSMLTVVGSSVAFSLIGGVLLHAGGVGSYLDRQLAKSMPMYNSMEKKELKMWINPEDGRLVGRLEGGVVLEATTTFRVEDGSEWALYVNELREPDLKALESGNRVRVIGMVVTSTPNTFHSCGVFPWMYDRKVSLTDMQAERRAFVERMYAHKDEAEERRTEIEQFVADASGRREDGVCAKHKSVERIGERMQ